MIKITRYSGGISVEGHAEYAEPGKDIVCAAVSVLTQTLIASLETLSIDTIQHNISPGSVDIKIWNLSERGQVLIDSFFIGVGMIADAYPNNVELSKR